MAEKRQTSKQRRASRNRAQRAALAARSENASVRPPAGAASSASSSSSAGGKATSTPASGARRASGRGKGRKRPGDTAVLVALGLAIVAVALLLNSDVPVDDRGEPLPAAFSGLAREARSVMVGEDLPEAGENIVSVYGAQVILLVSVPALVVAVTAFLNRRWEQRSRLLTISMLALAGMVILVGAFGVYYMPALIALAVAGFQVRKQELPARTAERVTRQRRGAEVIDVDEADDTEDAAGEGRREEDVRDDDEDDAASRDDEGGRSRGRSRRPNRSDRRATTDAAIARGDRGDEDEAADQADDPDEGASAGATGDRDEGPAGRAEGAGSAGGKGQGDDPDGLLAELEEELRRESEADETGRSKPGDDGDAGR